jgi:phosphoserine aminotransferase
MRAFQQTVQVYTTSHKHESQKKVVTSSTQETNHLQEVPSFLKALYITGIDSVDEDIANVQS